MHNTTVDVAEDLDLNQYSAPSNGHCKDWEIPAPLELPLPPVEDITPDMLPAPFRGWLTDISERLQVPLDFVAAPAIVLVGTVIGSRCTVRPKANDDWTVTPNLWGGVVGTPSMLKTPSLKEVLYPLKKLETNASTDFEIQKFEYDVEKEGINAQQESIKSALKKAFKDGGEEVDALKAQLREIMESQSGAPSMKRYRTNDATVEKLADLCQQNPNGLLVFRDELVGLLASFEKDGHEQARTFYLEGWAGDGSYTVDRIQRGTQFIKKICLSVFGGIQTEKLNGYLQKVVAGDNDGFIQRFQLLVYPDEPKAVRYVDRSPNHAEKERAQKVISFIDSMDFLQYGARLNSQGSDVPHFNFSPEAQSLFIEFYMNLQNRLLTDTELTPIMKEHLGKYRSLMPSLALIFHLIEIADGATVEAGISLQATQMAVRWCEVLETHANRIYNGLGNSVNAATRALSKKLLNDKIQNGFKAREITQNGWSALTKTKTVEKAIGELIELGWLLELPTPESENNPKGRPAKPRYCINPNIKIYR